MRRGSRVAGISPRSAMPLDDDLCRPWRQWWGLSISRALWLRRVGDRNMFVRSARFYFPGRMFFYFGGSSRSRAVRPLGSARGSRR